MAEQSKQSGILLTTIISGLSVIVGAYLGYVAKVKETSVQSEKIKEDTSVQNKQIMMEQIKFDAEQKLRHDETLRLLIPKLLGENEQERKIALATLFVLLPTETSDILTRVQSSLTDQQQSKTDKTLTDKAFTSEIGKAQNLANKTDEWIIVSGSDSTLEAANYEVARAIKNKYSASLYSKDNFYQTTIGPFPTQNDAQSANIAVRATLRSDAYVVNFKTWCPNPIPTNYGFSCTKSKS